MRRYDRASRNLLKFAVALHPGERFAYTTVLRRGLFQRFRHRMETEQGTLARPPKPRGKQAPLGFWVAEQLEADKDGIVPLESSALGLRFATLRPGPDLAMRRPEQEEAQSELLEAPSAAERRLPARVGELVAAQAVEDEAGRSGFRGGVAGPGLYHRYNAVLKRVTGGKSRAQMTVGTGGRDRLARAQPAVGARAPAPGRPPLRLVRPQAPGLEPARRAPILGRGSGQPFDIEPNRFGEREVECLV